MVALCAGWLASHLLLYGVELVARRALVLFRQIGKHQTQHQHRQIRMQQFVCIYRPTTWRGTQVRTIRLVGCRKRRDQRRQLLVIVMSLNRAFLCVVAGGSTSSEHHTCLHTSAPPSFLAPDDRLLKKIATHPSQMNGVKPKTFKKRQIPNTRSISAKTNYLRLVVIYTRTYIRLVTFPFPTMGNHRSNIINFNFRRGVCL